MAGIKGAGKGGRKRGGTKSGGRQKGTLNRATTERAILMQRQVTEARTKGKLGKEQLSEIMAIAANLAAYYQPRLVTPKEQRKTDDKPPAPVLQYRANDPAGERFREYLRLAMDAAKYVAPYESPTFRAIQVAPPPPETVNLGPKVVRLSIFDHSGKRLVGEMIRPQGNGSGNGSGNGHGLGHAIAMEALDDDDDPA
jgi:hypothetical protein